MDQMSKSKVTEGHRYALCVGIGSYTEMTNHNLRYAEADAKAIAERLGNPQRGNFDVKLLIGASQTTKHMLELAIDEMLNAPTMQAEDLVVIFISCHGDVYGKGNTFYLLPSNARLEADGMPRRTTVIDIYGLTTALSAARVKNIIFLLDVCHSGGAGAVLEHLGQNLSVDTNIFIIGAARHDQATTQSSQVEHGIFTNCLLQAFEQKPRKDDGWLTISDIYSFISEVIESETSKFSGQESSVKIQARSASVNPNLNFVKNPHYSPESCEFYETVKKLLELVQYEPVKITPQKGTTAGFYMAEIKVGLRNHRVGIIPFYNQIEPLSIQDAEKIALFMKEQVEQNNLNEGLVVTMLEVSNEVKETFQKGGARYLDVKTYDDIWKSLIDFKKYLARLTDEYQTVVPERHDDPSLDQVYIPLSVERRDYQANLDSDEILTKKFTDVSERGYQIIWEGDLENEVKQWLSDTNPTSTRLALLADYGSGKSTFCQHLAATLAREYLHIQEHERYHQRIPLFIPLRDFGRTPVDLKGYLVTYLKQDCRVNNPDVEALLKMAEAGLLLFILDGFDEMASRATNDIVSMNIEQFEQVANISKNKVLLTTRPEYFFNMYQQQQVLQAYPCLYLQPFNQQQVDLYLKKRVPFLKTHNGEPKKDWKYYRQQIDTIHDLTDLVRRPVLLEMIVKTLPILVAEGETVNRPNLYQRYLEGELDRQNLKQRRDLLIKRNKRFEIMERIALELYRIDKVELSSKQILNISKELLTHEQQEEMEGSLREIVTCSFLIRVGNEYHFSHQSFLEYLVALRLAKDIMSDKRENFQLKPLTRVIQDFLLELEVGAVPKNPNTGNVFMSFEGKRLENWFRSDPKDRWLSVNTFSLLVKLLPHEQWHQLPLNGADLYGVDLRGAELGEVKLGEAELGEANLHGADLHRADLHSANLGEADLGEANLEGANLHGANLHGANLHGANLRGADLHDANLVLANLEGANLEGANLEGTIKVNTEKTQSNYPSGIKIHWLLDR